MEIIRSRLWKKRCLAGQHRRYEERIFRTSSLLVSGVVILLDKPPFRCSSRLSNSESYLGKIESPRERYNVRNLQANSAWNWSDRPLVTVEDIKCQRRWKKLLYLPLCKSILHSQYKHRSQRFPPKIFWERSQAIRWPLFFAFHWYRCRWR